MAALLYYLDDTGVVLWCAVAAILHELGHYIAIWQCGGKVARLKLSCVGAEMVLSARHPLSHWGQIWSAVAGPGVNVLVALGVQPLAVEDGAPWYLFMGVNLGLALFNLLPVAQLDGGRALWHLIAIIGGELWAERIVSVLSLGISIVLTVLGGVVIATEGGTITLLITAIWLLGATVEHFLEGLKKKGRKKRNIPCHSP